MTPGWVQVASVVDPDLLVAEVGENERKKKAIMNGIKICHCIYNSCR